MISIYFQGRFQQKNRMERFACDVINHFFKRDRKEDIIIAVEMKKNLEENDSGSCVDLGRYDGSRYITISLSRRFIDEDENFAYSAKEIATTLAHELVHAKQFIRGELTSKALTYAFRRKVNESEYRKLPWEAEAYGNQEELVELYW